MSTKRLHSKKTYYNLGRATFKAYCDIRALPRIERKQEYSVTDLIVDVLHYAKRTGYDPDAIMRSALSHLDAETVEACPKCGKPVKHEDAFIDYGTGEETGRTFYYCSKECREKH